MIHTDFVGREGELEKLLSLLERALKGEHGLAVITGEAGAGKSFLIREFIARAQERHPELVVASGGCNAQTGSGTPYLPFIELISQLSGNVESKLATGSLTQRHVKRIRNTMAVTSRTLLEVAPDLLGTLIPGSSLLTKAAMFAAEKAGWIDQLDELFQQAEPDPADIPEEQILNQYGALIRRLAGRFPLLLSLDDLQWADASSLSLFHHLAFELEACPVLLVASHRPTEMAGRFGEMEFSQEAIHNQLKERYGDIWIHLVDLPLEEREGFVNVYLDACPNRFDRSFRQALFHKTGGHPLFVAELLQGLQESGRIHRDGDGCWSADPDLDWSMQPARMEDVINEGLGTLEPELYDLLSIAAVEGAQFTVPVLAEITGRGVLDLLKQLSHQLERHHHLVREGAVERINGHWLARFGFENASFQHYLYRSLTRRGRMILHLRVAECLSGLYGRDNEEFGLTLAHHYDRGGDALQASELYLREGRRHLRISSYREALKQLRRALDLLESLRADEATVRRMVEVYLPYSAALKAVRGWESPELLESYFRARELCRRRGGTPELSPFLFGLWAHYLVSLDLERATEVAAENTHLGEQLDNADIRIHGHIALGNTCFWQGRFNDCLNNMERATELLRDGQEIGFIQRYGQDSRTFIKMFHGFSHWLTGRLDLARRYQDEGVRLADAQAHPLSQAISLQASAWQAFHEGDLARCRADAERLEALTLHYEIAFYHPIGVMFQGYTRAMEGAPREGAETIREGYAEQSAMTGEKHLLHSLFSLLLVDALRAADDAPGALAVIERALEVQRERAFPAYRAELLRHRGELLAAGDREASRESLWEARAVAREQGAVMFELRAACAQLESSEMAAERQRLHEELTELAEAVHWLEECPDRVRLHDCLRRGGTVND